MRDGNHGAGEAHEELFEPLDRFGVEVVGRLVEQQHVGLREQQLAQRDAALFTAGKVPDYGIPGRQTQRVSGEFELAGKIGARGGDDRFEPRLFFGQLVEIGAFLGVGGVDLFQLLLRLHHFAHARFDFLAHGFFRVELRLLRQVADVQIGHRRRFADDVLVDPGHDAQDGRFARAVQAEQADLGTGEEGERDVLDDLALRRNDLADAVHCENVLSHGWIFCE